MFLKDFRPERSVFNCADFNLRGAEIAENSISKLKNLSGTGICHSLR